MRSRLTLAALALTFAVGACDRDAPTSPAAGTDNQAPAAPTAPKARQQLLFEGTQNFAGQPAITSTVQVTKFHYTQAGGLKIDGRITLQNAATGAVLDVQDFTGWSADLTKGAGAPTAPICPILELDIGAVHLDLLGLVVDLAPIHLDVVAESGPGNLLGNLLCALVGLLDGTGNLATITQLLTQINALLSQILAIIS